MLKRISLLVIIVILTACSSGEIQPVDIEANDMCSFCRMAISEKQFAAEIIEENEAVHKFDDIGCMLRYRKASGDSLKVAATFVTDHETRKWIPAENAFFTRSESVRTPMGSGIIAYTNDQSAGPNALRFDDLTAETK